MAQPGRRLYVGRISQDASRSDVERFFSTCGKVVDVRLLAGFGFIEYDDTRDAEDAVRDLNGRDFMGDRLIVEFAKAPRGSDGPRGYDRDDRGPPRRGGPPPRGYRLTIANLAEGTSWQDLKDFARAAGSVIYADVSRTDLTEGVIEYTYEADVDTALKTLDGTELNGNRIRLLDNLGGGYGQGRGGGGGGGRDRRDDRRDDDRRRPSPPPRERRYRDDDRDRPSYRDERSDRYREDDRYEKRDDRDRRRPSPPPRERSRSRSPRRDREDRRY